METKELMVTFELNVEETNQILASLQDAPYKSVKGLIDKIVAQAQASLPKQGEAPPTLDTEEE